MCFIVLQKTAVTRLLGSAQNVQSLLDDGTLFAALQQSTDNSAALAVTAFDVLAENAAAVQAETKEVSPFLRYRKEIMGQYETAGHLRKLVLNLWGGRQVDLSRLFMNADQHHTKIALDCIVAYTDRGENDAIFMKLCSDIIALRALEISDE